MGNKVKAVSADKKININTIIFLVFSIVSGFVELGGVFWSIEKGYSIVKIVGLGLAYQLGNLIPVPLQINRKIATILSLLAGCFIGINCFYKTSYTLCFVSTVFLAMVIQFARSEVKDNISTTLKRTFRVIGFMVAPFYNLYLAFAITILILLLVILQKNKQKLGFIKCKIKMLNIAMIIHQMHYFGYVYFLIIILVMQNQDLHKLTYGIIFTFSWLTYILVPHVIRGSKYFKYFIIGHAFLASLLLVMAASYRLTYAIILWILTGFGGGTVFCVGKINQENKVCSKYDLTFSENIGHILGVLGGILSYQITGKLYVPIIFSAVCAFCAMIVMAVFKLRYLKNSV